MDQRELLRRSALTSLAKFQETVASVMELLDERHRAVVSGARQVEELTNEVEGVLARGSSLRRKDFKAMFQDILDDHRAWEDEVSRAVSESVQEQRSLALALKEALLSVEDGGGDGADGVLRDLLASLKSGGLERGPEVREELYRLLHLQEEIIRVLQEIRDREGITPKDLKAQLDLLRNRQQTAGALGPARIRPTKAEGNASVALGSSA